MISIDQVIVCLWFLPVVCFIVLPLFIAFLGALYSIFDVFKASAGKEKEPIRTTP